MKTQTLVHQLTRAFKNFFLGEDIRRRCQGLSSEEIVEIMKTPHPPSDNSSSPYAKTLGKILSAQ